MPLANYLYLPRGRRITVEEPGDPGEGGDPVPVTTTFSLAVNPDFSRTSPTLKDGSALSGVQLDAWEGIDYLLDNFLPRATSPAGTVTSRAETGDTYQYGRDLGVIHNNLMTALRLFGDVRALDLAVEIADIQFSKLVLTPSTAADMTAIPLPTHPFRRWLWLYLESEPRYWGTDHHMDIARAHAPILQLLYALRQNHGVTSPKGYNYQAKADMWENYIKNDLIPAWQGPEQVVGITRSGSSWVPATGWDKKYEGSWHGYYTGHNDPENERANLNGNPMWPIFSRHHTHTHIGCSILHYWLGKAIPEYSAATVVGLDGIMEAFFNRNMCYFTTATGGALTYPGSYGIWPRSLAYTGHGFTQTYPQPGPYTSYIFMDLLNMWLDGGLPDFPATFGIPVTKTMNQYMWREVNDRGTWISGSIMDAEYPTNAVNTRGDPMPFFSAKGEGGYGSANIIWAGCNVGGMYMAFDTDDDYMENYLTDMLKESSLLSENKVGIAQPRVLPANIGIVLKHANARDWVLDEDG